MRFIFFLTGIATILGVGYLLSAKKKDIKLRPIVWGLSLQILFGVIVIFWPTGNAALRTVAGWVSSFLAFSQEGATFIFGNLADPKYPHGLGFQFAFMVLPTIIFFSAVMSILYHYGIMQRVVAAMAWFMSKTLGTSGSESLSCSANVFVGQTEAPLIVKPYVDKMTMSELNAVMVGGFGTIAGGIMAAYIQMGVNPAHIITASLMAAPASLMMAKIIFPETEESVTGGGKVKMDLEVDTTNGIEAAAKGTSNGLMLALNVGAMLIAFIAIIAIFNSALGLLDYYIDGKLLGAAKDAATGEYAGYVPGSLKTIFSIILWPLAWLMGVPFKDCGSFSYLIGMKLSLNEFMAYSELIKIKNIMGAENVELAQYGGVFASGMDTYGTYLSMKAEAMATFALCGFANFASVAIQIGGITPMVKAEQQDELRAKLSKLGLRAMFGGALVSCLTATIAGLLL